MISATGYTVWKVNRDIDKTISELSQSLFEQRVQKEMAPSETGEQTVKPTKTEIDTSNWKVYRNLKQGFEIKFPPTGKWDYTIEVDKNGEMGQLRRFDASFNVSEEGNYVSYRMRINFFSEVTPTLPPWPFCKTEREMLLWNNKVLRIIYSSYNLKIEVDKEKCTSFLDKFLFNEHSIET